MSSSYHPAIYVSKMHAEAAQHVLPKQPLTENRALAEKWLARAYRSRANRSLSTSVSVLLVVKTPKMLLHSPMRDVVPSGPWYGVDGTLRVLHRVYVPTEDLFLLDVEARITGDAVDPISISMVVPGDDGE